MKIEVKKSWLSALILLALAAAAIVYLAGNLGSQVRISSLTVPSSCCSSGS